MQFTGKYRFLSNFFPISIYHMDVFFTSAEHAYQAAKSSSKQAREHIAALETPAMAKQYGRHILIRPRWEEEKLMVMEDILRLKFQRNHIMLRRMLAETNPLEIVEDNHWGDRFWGSCMGYGENHLGKLLMKIRAEVLEDDWSQSL
jgi:ribA/ribD-fused uncharacterized protein